MDKIRLMAQLEIDEGLRLYPYKCSGNRWTIGVGRNFEDNPFNLDELIFLGIKGRTFDAILEELTRKGISRGDALYLLENDVDKVYNQLKKQFSWFESKPDVVQQVLCNVCFNLGLGGLLKFKKTLEFVRLNKYEEAADEMMDSIWSKQVGARADRLTDLLRTQAS